MDSIPACIAVACSGGRDSVALLHATAKAALAWPGLEVVALHVHHGLSAFADQWLEHVQQLCVDWRAQGLPVQFASRRLTLNLAPGDSLEAKARVARYEALADMARQAGADIVLLAHHQRDQAETFLLQALRGAGVAGLAAMPRWAERHGITWARPWLKRTRQEVEDYVACHGLRFVDDDSNADVRHARNRLRLNVMPALRANFPQADIVLTQASKNNADASWCLRQWADQAINGLVVKGSDGGHDPARIDAHLWVKRPGAERRELLRHWYADLTGRSLSRTWIERLDREMCGAIETGNPAHWPPVQLGVYRGQIIWRAAVDPAADTVPGAPKPGALHVGGPGRYDLPMWGGALVVSEAEPGSIEPAVPWPLLASMEIRAREGGEKFQLAKNRPARALRKQFQALAVPAWHRHAPLFYAQDSLVFVPGLGVDARVQAADGQEAAHLSWVSLPQGGVTG